MPCVGAYEPVLPRPASLPARRGEEAPDRRREVRPLRAGERDGAATSWRVALVLEPLAQQLESAPEPHLHRAFRRVEVGCDIAEGLSVQKPSQHDLPLRRGKVGEGRAERTSELGFGNRSSPVRRQPLLRRLQRDLLTVPATQMRPPIVDGRPPATRARENARRARVDAPQLPHPQIPAGRAPPPRGDPQSGEAGTDTRRRSGAETPFRQRPP